MPLSAEQIKRLSSELDEVLSLPKSDWHLWARTKNRPGDPVDARLRNIVESGRLEQTLSCDALDRSLHLPNHGEACATGNLQPFATVGAIIGAYRLVERISDGGMGSVWLAERADGAYKRRVALKLPFVGANAAALAKRFEVERDILALLEHRNIARFYDAGSANTTPFIALEYVAGIPITQYCEEKKLPIRARLSLFRQVLRAVQYAHTHLVIHRDLKPSNVLVTADGDVKLLDFGIAQLLDVSSVGLPLVDAATHMNSHSLPREQNVEVVPRILTSDETSTANARTQGELTRAYGNVMTPRYASPEQVLGEAITTASDVYSLAVLLFRLLTGRSPYDVDNTNPRAELALVRNKILAGELRTADFNTHTQERVDSEIKAMLSKALSRNPEDRYVSASEFDNDISRFLSYVPVRARAQPLANRTRLFFRRNWLASASVAITFSGLAAFAGYVYFESEVQRRSKEFLLQALTPTSYYTDGGVVLTHAEMLNRAAAGVEQKFADQPRVQAEIYQAIGESLFNLGEHQDAFLIRTRAQPVVDATFGRTSREAIRNANRAAYMHLTQRRLPEFQQSLADLLTRCPSLNAVPEDKCYGTIWLQTHYYAYTGEGAKRKALWDDYDARISPNVSADSRWHTLANYWGASAARQTGDLVATKARWAKLLSLKSTQDGAKGDHMKALSVAATMNAMGLREEAAALGRDLYAQGERYMGDAFDAHLFYMPNVVETQAAANVDYGGETLLRRGIERIDTLSLARNNANMEKETIDARAALALLLISQRRYAEARGPLERAITLQRTFNIDHDQYLLEMQMHAIALDHLEFPANDEARTREHLHTLSTWRARAVRAQDDASLPRIDALMALLETDPALADTHWARANETMLRTHARPHDTAILLKAFNSLYAMPPPVDDETVAAMRRYAKKVLAATDEALAKRGKPKE